MDGTIVVVAVLGALTLAIGFRLLAGTMDKQRIASYVASAGGRIESISWNPFGPGWFGEKSDRIYHVRYVDGQGFRHNAHCKTSLTTGVYFTEDRVVGGGNFAPQLYAAPVADDRAELLKENRRLREELTRLKKDSRDVK
jgi:hypothetical protein